MCTAVSYQTRTHYFGRTLDLEYTYRESITVTPRRFPFRFRCGKTLENHLALIGMATVEEDYPLYYEAANECGLGMAGLNFPGYAHYFPPVPDKDNIASFELIPWILSQCRNLAQARTKLMNLSVCDLPFSAALPPSPLHWLIADKTGALSVESTQSGLHVHENPAGVLTNSPPFDYHMTRLSDYMALSPDPTENRFGDISLPAYSRGMGAMGLPGDLSSVSRFVRAAFTRMNAVSDDDENAGVSQFFHILGTVSQPRGSVRLADGRCVITQYTSCINTDRGIYYYTTYENSAVSAVDMHRCNLGSDTLECFPLLKTLKIHCQN